MQKKKKKKRNFFLTLRLIDANRIKVFITVYSTILNSQGRNLPNRFKKQTQKWDHLSGFHIDVQSCGYQNAKLVSFWPFFAGDSKKIDKTLKN